MFVLSIRISLIVKIIYPSSKYSMLWNNVAILNNIFNNNLNRLVVKELG